MHAFLTSSRIFIYENEPDAGANEPGVHRPLRRHIEELRHGSTLTGRETTS
jgi:hypothetical protein